MAGRFRRVGPHGHRGDRALASPVIHFRRTVTADGARLGDHVRGRRQGRMWYWSANRDEAVFADADRFDVGRKPNDHVGFGGPGPHFCLGPTWRAERSCWPSESCSASCRISTPPASQTACARPLSMASSTCRRSGLFPGASDLGCWGARGQVLGHPGHGQLHLLCDSPPPLARRVWRLAGRHGCRCSHRSASSASEED